MKERGYYLKDNNNVRANESCAIPIRVDIILLVK